MLCAMSVIARPRVLLLLGVIAGSGACGGDDDGPAGGAPDAAPPLDAAADARPESMVMLGSRGACPREIHADGDTLYWLEGDALVRSSATTFSPEVVYTGVNGGHLQVAGDAVYWLGTWPVRLDLEERVARPIVTTDVTGLTIVDGARPIVIAEDNRIAEIEPSGVLRELHTEPEATTRLTDLERSGTWLFWTRRSIGGGAYLQWRDAVGGFYGSGFFADGRTLFASGDRLALMVQLIDGRNSIVAIRDGVTSERQYLSFTPARLAVASDSSVYVLGAEDDRLSHAAPSAELHRFVPTSTTQRFDELVAVGEGAVVVDCSGPATYYRWYP
jgi:hypothetical protein